MVELSSHKNELLSSLPSGETKLIAPHLVDVEIADGHILFNPGDIIREAYFPSTAVLSVMNVTRDGQTVEVAAVGNDGMVGLRLFYDDDEAIARVMCQVPGHAFKIEGDTFWHLVRHQPGLRHVIHQHAHAFLFEVFQSAACNKIHGIPQRFARWLLTKQDRSDRTTFPLGEGKIAAMLNVTLPTVRGLIRQLRDRRVIAVRGEDISIVNRPGLEGIACECYERVRLELFKISVKRRSVPT